ncbi:hypothetical protein RB195_018492 [Necator americanus]|uniref:Uncharacterized protein n=1 Tax=Necator americanus TaxID=51031 RepID=A0ABR1CB51_NECAM
MSTLTLHSLHNQWLFSVHFDIYAFDSPAQTEKMKMHRILEGGIQPNQRCWGSGRSSRVKSMKAVTLNSRSIS